MRAWYAGLRVVQPVARLDSTHGLYTAATRCGMGFDNSRHNNAVVFLTIFEFAMLGRKPEDYGSQLWPPKTAAVLAAQMIATTKPTVTTTPTAISMLRFL